MLGANAQALEKIMQKLRQLKGSLLSRDAYDRWSHAAPEELAENQEAMSREDREVKVLQEKLQAEVARLRVTDTQAIAEWTAAHEALLTHFIGTQRQDAEKNRTELYVAEGELVEWRKLKNGEVSFVDQNVFYVHYDPELYRSYFE